MRKLHLRPSNTERLINCNLSVLLPEEEKTERQNQYLEERSNDHKRLSEGKFLEHEEKCRDFHDRVVAQCGGNVFREQTLIHNLNGYEFKGTPDFFGYSNETKRVYIIDFKTGFHLVLAQENMQLLSYAALIFLRKSDWDIKHFCLAILNTQKDIVSTFNVSLETVLHHIARIERNLKFTYEEETFFAIKGDWCRFCPSKNYCPLHIDKSKVKKYFNYDTDDLISEYESRKKEIKARKRKQRKLQPL